MLAFYIVLTKVVLGQSDIDRIPLQFSDVRPVELPLKLDITEFFSQGRLFKRQDCTQEGGLCFGINDQMALANPPR